MELSLTLGGGGEYTTGEELEKFYQKNPENADALRRIVTNMRDIMSEDRVGTIELEITLPRGDIKYSQMEHTLPTFGNRQMHIFKEWEILYDLVEHGKIRQKFHQHKFMCSEIRSLMDQMEDQAKEYDPETEGLIYETLEQLDTVLESLAQ